jgi:hypothetical protein
MNLEELNFSFTAMQWVVLTVVAIHSWFVSRQSASAREMLELRTRIVALEEHVKHLPDQSAVTDLRGDMRAIRAELTGVKDALGPLARSLDRINDYLLREKA